MKKTLIAVMVSTVALSNSFTAFAAPETMADGTVFDAEYYAQNNPDVAALYGTDKNELYQHYVTSGKAEGRKAYSDNEVAMTRYGVLLEAGDENYLRMGNLMCGFDYSLTPITEKVYYTLEDEKWVEHREPLETPRISDPAADFVRSDWSGDARYQALRDEIIQKVASKGAGVEIRGEALNFTQYPLSEAEFKESDQMLKNLSVDLMKGGILDNCSLTWVSKDGYLYFKRWGYEQTVDVLANRNDATMSQYDKHPEIWGYINKSRNELYDDTDEVKENLGSDWGFSQ